MSCCGKKPAASAFVRAKDKWNEYAENYRQRLEICGNCIELNASIQSFRLGHQLQN